jgi:hypothetical protein
MDCNYLVTIDLVVLFHNIYGLIDQVWAVQFNRPHFYIY